MNSEIKIKPRLYQEKIFHSAVAENTLVILPTGLGKTMIALMLAIYQLKKNKDSKILFLAPTKPLCEQHLKYFSKNINKKLEMEILTGKIKPEKRKELWEKSSVFFSTPQTVTHDILSRRCNLKNVFLVIFDEAHRTSGKYDYEFIARQVKKDCRILALSASPGSDESRIREVCSALKISKIEARSENSPEVKPYIRKKKIEKIFLELPDEMKKGKKLIEDILKKFLKELKEKGGIESCDINLVRKRDLILLQKKLASSPEKEFEILKMISLCAVCIKLMHCLELLQTQGIAPLSKFIENLKSQAAKTKASKTIVNDGEFKKAMKIIFELEKEKKEHPKFEKVLEIIKRYSGKKIIVFTQYRSTIDRIVKMLIENNISAKKFIGQKEGMNQKKQQETIREFVEGKIDVLVSSSIAEEGIHISDANIGIFFEPVPSGLRKVQREGRVGRVNIGKIYVLITKNTVDEKYYWSAFHKERKMSEAISKIQSGHKERISPQKRLDEFGR